MNDVLPPNSLAGRGIGDNSTAAPLAEVLRDELAPYRARADELLAAAAEARITSAAEAGKAADLVLLIHNFENELDSVRQRRKKPHLSNCRLIDAAFGALIGPLARARTGDEDQIGLVEMIGKWQDANGDRPVHASYAAVGSRRKSNCVIEDLPAAIDWLLREHPGRIAHAARTIIGALAHEAGVDAIERGEVKIPGVSVSIARTTQVR